MARFGNALDKGIDILEIIESSEEPLSFSDLRSRISIPQASFARYLKVLAERGYVAVYPVIGWWRESPRHQRWNKRTRYSLVVSIRSPETDVELYSAVQNIIRQPVEILIS